jgi:hypothetical protein
LVKAMLLRQLSTILLSLLSVAALRAQEAAEAPPKLGQPSDFSEIVGAFQITSEAKPTTVAVEEPLTFTVTITGSAVPPYVPTRDKLRIFPDDVQRDFYVEPVAEMEKNGSWEFVYCLRPKRAQVKFVPSLKLVYYAPRQRRYQTAYTDAIPLTVKPRQEAAVSVPGLRVIQAPASFYQLSSHDTSDSAFAMAVLQQAPYVLLLLAAAPPMMCLVGIWCWRHRRRKIGERARQSQRLMEQTAATLVRSPQDATTTTRLLTEYLRLRMDFPAQEPTPREVERWLKFRGIAKSVREQWRRLLSGYDAGRFAPETASRQVVVGAEVVELIRVLEDEACRAGR